ncbi:hypothetical protein GQ457_02G019460 [Hibiscus cannabinus]
MVAIGGVIRDANGEWILGFARSLGVSSVLMSKLWTVHDVLFYSWRHELCKIVIETDNVMVANIIHENSKALAECALVAIIRELFFQQWEVKLHRICREPNMVVDRLVTLM